MRGRSMLTRENAKLAVVGALCVLVGLAGPSAAGAVKKGLNADKVDGLSAVKAKAPVKKRKNKLVATDKKGYLPDGIVRRVPNADDAAKLGGKAPAAYRPISVSWSAMRSAASTLSNVAWYLADATSDTVDFSVVLPDTYVTGTPVTVDFTVDRSATNPCTVAVAAAAFVVSGSRGLQVVTQVELEDANGSNATVPLTGPTTITAVATPLGPATFQAGDTMNVSLVRLGNDGSDVCAATGLVIYGARVSS